MIIWMTGRWKERKAVDFSGIKLLLDPLLKFTLKFTIFFEQPDLLSISRIERAFCVFVADTI